MEVETPVLRKRKDEYADNNSSDEPDIKEDKPLTSIVPEEIKPTSDSENKVNRKKSFKN